MTLAQRSANAVLYVVPGVSVVLACTILFLGRSRAGMGVKIYGGPPGEDGIAAWRVLALERAYGVDVPCRNRQLVLAVSDHGRQLATVEGTTDNEGAWEARIAVGKRRGTVRVHVRTAEANSRIIGLGEVTLTPPEWDIAFRTRPAYAPGHASGDLSISVSLMRGVAAAPYPEDAVIEVKQSSDGTPIVRATVAIQGDGVLVESGSDASTDAHGRVIARLRPVEHAASMAVKATTASGRQGSWEGSLPVVPGMLWIDPRASAQGRLLVLSPVGHRFAYVTLFERGARLFGTRIMLRSDSEGGAKGEAQVPLPAQTDTWVLVSPDAPGRETEITAWPIPRDPASLEPLSAAMVRSVLLMDGMAVAESTAHMQIQRTKYRVLFVLGLAATLEAVLLSHRARQARRTLERLFARQAELDLVVIKSLAGGQGLWVKLTIASLVVALGFLAIAFVTWLGPG